MRLPHSVDAVALYGSRVRGDHDLLSDEDVLLIGSEEVRATASDQLRSEGMSPSFYTWEQFYGLVGKGSLFVQHLKQESRIVVDTGGRLRGALRSFRPTEDLELRLQQTLHLLTLTGRAVDVPAAGLWALDVLAVTFRNFAIVRNAESGRFIFGFSDLVRSVSDNAGLSGAEQTLLLRLRKYKSEYRNKIQTSHTCEIMQDLTKIQRILVRLLETSDSFWLRSPELTPRFLDHPSGCHWYVGLRWWEGLYRAHEHASDLELAKRSELETLIASPNPYSNPQSVGRVRSLVAECCWGANDLR